MCSTTTSPIPRCCPPPFEASAWMDALLPPVRMQGPTSRLISHLYHNRITIKGRPGYHAPDVAKCFAAAAEGKIKPHIARALPLSQAPEAHRMREAGEEQGKIVLDPTLG